MKFLITLFVFNFLCVWCFGLEDCAGDEITCDELLPLRPELSDVIAYEDRESVAYGFEGSNTTHHIFAFRNEFEAGVSQRCQDEINAGFSVLEAEGDGFSLTLSTDVFNRSVLHLGFTFFCASGPTTTEIFEVVFDESGSADVLPPLLSRTISDTLLAGTAYEDVLLVEVPEADVPGQVSAFYYSTSGGLLRAERLDQPAFIRLD